MGDQDKEKSMENPDVVHKVSAIGLTGLGVRLTRPLDPGLRPDQELRMVLVKLRSREGSVSERLCNVWLDDARDELVIVYETVKKLCIGSHVSK
ncbi:hypothetical protein YC2023_071961 [Brassica napus]